MGAKCETFDHFTTKPQKVLLRIKEFNVEQAAPCQTSGNETYVIQFPDGVNYTFENNLVDFHGNFTVSEAIKEPLEFVVVTNRCSLDMKTCEPFNKIALGGVCATINDANGMLAPFFAGLEPKFRCPIEPGVYRFRNAVVDLRFFTTFPLEGYRWQAKLKLYSKTKNRRELFCLAELVSMKWVRKA
ncbi:conserved hypothetical protein [Culex quinquefasciatus]|uniref:MD-2-related lipid-recognition domain-containing protein n=1 Tax=Culex quinquefasciatus TaxID=7176 RepID=B0XBI9_CULQU|nr:conserved hypothetical protein [Culex quinquefasciatus]|eukprot:XP_001867011.1 conserved hypothetical protein [Culex quinquefasciatus]